MEERESLYVEKIQTLLQKETVSDYGDTDLTKFYEFRELLRKTFPNLFAVCEEEDFEGSLLLRWRGSEQSGKPVMYMNHFDVVSAEGEWKYPPFSATVADGKIWARGVLDTKGGLFCMLQAGEELAKEGFMPKNDIYFESARTEEAEGTGAESIAKTLAERGVRLAYSLDEGGMIVHDPIGGADGDFAMIGVGEKNSLTIKFSAESTGGHASMPGKNTPIVRLSKFVANVEKAHIFKRKIDPAIFELFKRSSTKMSGALKFILGHAEFFAPILKIVLPMVSPAAGAMIATTCAFTQSGGSKSFNSLPQEAYVVANMRASHHQGSENSVKAIKKIADKYNLKMEVTDKGLDSSISDFRNEPYKMVENAIKQIYPEVVPTPYIMTGASDSRFIDKISDNCIRFIPFFIDDQQLSSIHGIDENVNISCLPKTVDFYKILMEKN